MKLKVTSVEMKDVLGAKEFAIEPGKITVISGENASGKSTHLEVIKNVIGGGNLAKLSRIPGEDDLFEEDPSPEVVLVLTEDGGKHYRIEKNQNALRVRQQVGGTAGLEDMPQPQRWLSGLHDGQLSNPIEFLKAPEKKRVLLLLESLPVDYDRKALWKRMRLRPKDFSAVPDGLHPVTEIAMIRENVFRERTGVNRDEKAKSESAEQTRRATPAVIPDDHEQEIAELDESISEFRANLTSRKNEIKVAAQIAAQDLRNTHQEWAEKERAILEREIAKNKDTTFEEITEIELERDVKLDNLEPERDQLVEDEKRLATMREQAKSAIRARTLKEQADRFESEAAVLKEKRDDLTAALNTLDQYRRELLDSCPIPGLEVDGKTITIDGIPYDLLNTEKKIRIAVKVACLRSHGNPLPIIFVDGAEALDSKHFEALCKEIDEEDVQAFIGRVSDSPLKVESR